MYTVKQLAKSAGISVRTLHYYDEIGLLKPSFLKENGYRYYGEKELLKLQQILFFRELEFPLEDIGKIVNASDFDVLGALKDQKQLLELKKKRIEGLLQTIDTTVRSLKGGENMSNDDMYGSFTKDELEKYKEEAKQRWGHTDAYKQSIERTKNWTKEDYKKVEEEGKKLTQSIAEHMNKGIESKEVQSLIEQHFNSLRQFYEPSYEMYRGLGKMYVEDHRFTRYYEKFRHGLAQFMCDAIAYYCDMHEKS